MPAGAGSIRSPGGSARCKLRTGIIDSEVLAGTVFGLTGAGNRGGIAVS